MSRYISARDAQELIAARITKPPESIFLPLQRALGYPLADAIKSPLAVPPFPRSAMDGYAIQAADAPGHLIVIGTSYAGTPWQGRLHSGEAVRIMTGAPVPDGADTVIEQESVTTGDDTVHLTKAAKARRNIMAKGHEYQTGDIVLSEGTVMTAINVGQLASIGITEVAVVKPPRVFVVTSGDELVASPPLPPGKIYNTNGPLLEALLQSFHADVTVTHVGDRHQDLKDALLSARDRYDLILTTGGVSVGERDYLPIILSEDFERLFWRADIHPGKAMAAAMVGATPLIALSGNPGAMLTGYYVIVAPLLAQMSGLTWDRTSVVGRLGAPYRKATRETRYLKAYFRSDAEGIRFDVIDNQSSDALNSFAEADGLVVIPHGSPPQDAGTVLSGFRLPKS